jgi:hypothetical protein
MSSIRSTDASVTTSQFTLTPAGRDIGGGYFQEARSGRALRRFCELSQPTGRSLRDILKYGLVKPRRPLNQPRNDGSILPLQ